ncbi:diguanylate cyclase (GGDEF)-like protein [Kineococcus xinjiangensis]|uniref:Diguanylate cyclase (GGDEF)-like protein n=1 Tax=Kineococcus xinjiangensis TaxID=512762 RepID=A0A2S6II18_9ACTN|nr:EAL domain-containing protein [Kineococcus xinjiangensis]PPK93863.1 diguanylate cyclase (GGDEF)-like protein [Kineococcus xinjiangensis]
MLWLYWVAALVIGGSTLRVTRALAAAQTHAQALAAQAQASEAQARVSAAQARDLAGQAQELAARAQELAARREYDAMHDALTGLPNRVLYADRLATAAAHAQRCGADVAVLLIDVDRFKLVNDSRGHQCGDELLIALTRRLTRAVRASDTLARLGGDEFAVIVQDVHTPADALAAAAHLRAALREPFPLDGTGTAGPQSVYVTASTGIAFARGRGEGELEVVLREADAAMYLAKARGRGEVEVFDESMGEVAQRRLHLENQLRHDVETGSDALSVAFQPLVDPRDGRVLGVEALARWNSTPYGVIGPDEFIAIAEDCELIHDLGRSVLHTTLEHAAWWHSLHPELEIAVNVSPVQLRRPDFAQQVSAALARARVVPQRLCLEITESVLLDTEGATVANLQALDEDGIALAVDDFGSGCSSLGQLRRFAISKLKADRSFVDDPALLRAVADLAAALGASALAEGVETPEQQQSLVRLGYRQAQGYLWARPQPATAITDLLGPRRETHATVTPPPPRRTGG